MMAGDTSNSSAEIQQLSLEIASLLSKTLSPEQNVRKTAEETLLKLEGSCKLYGLAALYLTRRDDLANEVRISAAIAFKNFIKRNWPYDPTDESTDQVDKIEPQQRDMIKQHITKFMIDSSDHIQRQLSEVITIIGKSDFPEKWPTLMVELRESLMSQEQNFNTLLGVLKTAYSIFRRYSYEIASNRLWTEIKLAVEHFGPLLTERFSDLAMAAKTNEDPSKLPPIYHCLMLCTKIFQSLITQDLPEYFEDRLNIWLPNLIDLLNVQVKISEPPMVIEDMKSEICSVARLFVQRYFDAKDSQEYTQKFAQNIWNLLVTTNQETQYDTLVSSAINFLTTVAEKFELRSMFQDATVLNLLCQRVIIPNMTIREIDEELFEDDPEEYVKRDIEGSDYFTRRRTACELVGALSKFLEPQLVEIFGRYIEEMFQSYSTNPNSNWKHKDLAIFLYSAMAIKGSTRGYGTVKVSELVNVEKFLEDRVIDALLKETNHSGSLILQADALRYIMTFRQHISISNLVMRLPLIVKHITSTNVVVRTYASITLQKLLTMKDPNQKSTTAFKPEQFEPFLGELIKTLFDALEMPGSSENEHIMKAIMQLFSFSKSSLLVQFLPSVVPKITTKLGIVAKNPSKPYFNHYLFETLALTIRAACAQETTAFRDEFENVLLNILQVVFAQDVQEFTPYVLQLLNIILKAQNTGSISEKFTNLFNELLSPVLWERQANVKPLTELMHTYIEKTSQTIVYQNKLVPILGIFQKLIASKATDHEGLALLQTMMIHLPSNELDSRMRDIFMLIFQRLTGSKTLKFVRSVLVCFSLYAYIRGPDVLASAVNQLQDKIFGMVVEKLYVADAKKVVAMPDRRICVCGMIKILSHLPLLDNGAYNHLWPSLLLVIMEIFELPMESADYEDDNFVDIDEQTDFQAQYSRLIYATVKRNDPTTEVGDLKSLLVVSLANLSTKLPGFIPNALSGIDQSVSNCLMGYFKAANVTVS